MAMGKISLVTYSNGGGCALGRSLTCLIGAGGSARGFGWLLAGVHGAIAVEDDLGVRAAEANFGEFAVVLINE
jgi:hypothetical protein